MTARITAVLFLVGLAGCAITPQNPLALRSVEHNTNEAVIADDDFTFENDLIKISWVSLDSGFAFHLLNKTDSTMQVHWDRSVYVGPTGESYRVMHEGVKYVDRNDSQPPTVIVKGGTLTDRIVPTNIIHYADGVGWYEGRIVEADDVGQTVKVLLAIEVEERMYEYIFAFEVLPLSEKE